jgi:UDP-glucose:(heptosyl)LPS alpha-1,3-glucosyltransferase
VFVLPTVYDPFSNACLEALAAGLPVLTTHANGFAEIITEGVHGSIFAPGDVAALGSALHSWRERAAEARERCQALAARYSVAENTRRSLAVLTKRESTPA